MKRWMIFSVCALLLVGITTTATARSIWLPPTTSNEMRLTALHPSFDFVDLDAQSMLWTLSVDNRIRPGRWFVCEVPLAHLSADGLDGGTTIGNPYLGMRVDGADSPWSGDVGVRLPLVSADEAATEMGLLGDLVDNAEAWWPDYLTAQAMATWYRADSNAPGFRFGFGPALWFYTGDSDWADDFEIYLRYYGQVVFPSNDVMFGAGISGRLHLTEDYDGLSESTIHDIAIFAGRRTGKWRPAGRVRIPWDEDMAEFVDVAFELSLGRGF